jgi:deoxyxylulose-5-phosphate synthase
MVETHTSDNGAVPSQAAKLFDCRDAFSKTVLELAAEDTRVCVVVNDSVSSTKLKPFQERFLERFVNVGIAEQNMLGVGAGLANGGMIPFVCGASCFLTARSMEQLKVDLAYSKRNVKLCGMSSGMAYGQLGPTHHSIEDTAWTRILPNLEVIIPADPAETAAAIRYAYQHEVRSSFASVACPCRRSCRRSIALRQAARRCCTLAMMWQCLPRVSWSTAPSMQPLRSNSEAFTRVS